MIVQVVRRQGSDAVMDGPDEPNKKRRSSSSNYGSAPSAKKQALTAMPDDGKVDPVVLQFKNQKLAQQLELHKSQIFLLETKFKDMQAKQALYDETLACVNRKWNQLIEDLELLLVRANGNTNGLHVLEHVVQNDKYLMADPPEATFLYRLLKSGSSEPSTTDASVSSVDRALSGRSAETVKTLHQIVDAIDRQRARNDELAAALRHEVSTDDAGQILRTEDERLRKEVDDLRFTMDALHVRHREIFAEVSTLQDDRAKDQAELRKVQAELDATLVDLDNARRKLAAANDRDYGAGPPGPSGAVSGFGGREPADKAVSKEKERFASEVKLLKAALAEAESLAESRLAELREAHTAKVDVMHQLHQAQAVALDEQHITSTRPYIALAERLHRCLADLEDARGSINMLLRERDLALLKERDMIYKAEAGDTARRACVLADQRCADLETKLQQCMAERDGLERKLEETLKAAGRTETVNELRVMVGTLHKELTMLQAQLSKYKTEAGAVPALRAQAQSQAMTLERKSRECEELALRNTSQVAVLKDLQQQIKFLKTSEMELRLFVDMFEQASNDPRDVLELAKAERRAIAQAEQLRRELDEHTLELRVKAAIEAEAACQQRLAAAESEIAQLRHSADASQRELAELRESLRVKNEEGDNYIAEIETIGNAYEDMQQQNKRLLQQIAERDDYANQLMSENVRAKQLQASLVAEKESMGTRIQHANAAADLQKQRVARLEEQLKSTVEQLAKVMEEARQYVVQLEANKRLAREAEEVASSAKEDLEQAEKEREERDKQVEALQGEVERERFKRKRAEEESQALSNKIARLTSSQERGADVERLQQEVDIYKKAIKCNVCLDRNKEVVITKCFHTFCSPCIQRNLEIRHRKCPGCGVPFGQNDVHQVFI